MFIFSKKGLHRKCLTGFWLRLCNVQRICWVYSLKKKEKIKGEKASGYSCPKDDTEN